MSDPHAELVASAERFPVTRGLDGSASAARCVRWWPRARVAITSRSKDRIASAAEAIGAAGLVWDSARPRRRAAPSSHPVRGCARRAGRTCSCATPAGPGFGPDPLAFSRDEWEARATGRSCSRRWRWCGRSCPGARTGAGAHPGRGLDVGARAHRPARCSRNAERSADLVRTSRPSRVRWPSRRRHAHPVFRLDLTDRLSRCAGSAEAPRRLLRRAVPAEASRHGRGGRGDRGLPLQRPRVLRHGRRAPRGRRPARRHRPRTGRACPPRFGPPSCGAAPQPSAARQLATCGAPSSGSGRTWSVRSSAGGPVDRVLTPL